MLDEIGEWRLRHNSYFVSITFTPDRRPCVVVTDALRGTLPDDVRREILADLAEVVAALQADLQGRLAVG